MGKTIVQQKGKPGKAGKCFCNSLITLRKEMKFSFTDFISDCDQIRRESS